jgi:hypothetical protein
MTTISSFDFNVQNYSNEELEQLLGLQNNYTINDIISSKQKLCIQLASATGSIQMQSQLSDFLDAASKCLISAAASNAKSKATETKLSENYFDSSQHFPNNTIIPGSAADGHFVIADAYRMTPLKEYNSVGGLKIGEYGAPPGKINPVKYSTIVSSVNIDSRFRPNYFNTKSTDLHVTLPGRIDNVISYRVGSIEIPFYAIYSVSELNGNNAIQIVWGNYASSPTYTDTLTILIPDGNYYTTADSTNVLASASIEKTINTILTSNTSSSITGNSGNGLSGILNFHIDQISGKSVFTQPNGAPPISFKIITNIRSNGNPNYDAPLLSFLGWSLGFRNAEYISNNNGVGNFGSVVSEAIAAFKAASYIFVAVDDYNNSVNDYYSAVFTDSYAIKNVITRVNVGLLREISEASSTQLNRQRNFFGPVNIQRLHITLYDNFGRIIDLNNMDWNMELIFECVYGG